MKSGKHIHGIYLVYRWWLPFIADKTVKGESGKEAFDKLNS
jgi:hypothetical protein